MPALSIRLECTSGTLFMYCSRPSVWTLYVDLRMVFWWLAEQWCTHTFSVGFWRSPFWELAPQTINNLLLWVAPYAQMSIKLLSSTCSHCIWCLSKSLYTSILYLQFWRESAHWLVTNPLNPVSTPVDTDFWWHSTMIFWKLMHVQSTSLSWWSRPVIKFKATNFTLIME